MIFLIISFILFIPILWKIRLLLTQRRRPEDFFTKGELFNIEVEKWLVLLSVIFLFLFLYFSWYEKPELR